MDSKNDNVKLNLVDEFEEVAETPDQNVKESPCHGAKVDASECLPVYEEIKSRLGRDYLRGKEGIRNHNEEFYSHLKHDLAWKVSHHCLFRSEFEEMKLLMNEFEQNLLDLDLAKDATDICEYGSAISKTVIKCKDIFSVDKLFYRPMKS